MSTSLRGHGLLNSPCLRKVVGRAPGAGLGKSPCLGNQLIPTVDSQRRVQHLLKHALPLDLVHGLPSAYRWVPQAVLADLPDGVGQQFAVTPGLRLGSPTAPKILRSKKLSALIANNTAIVYHTAPFDDLIYG